jgi:TPR repeat protein
MSVWRIKDVEPTTRSQAEAAAAKAGMPLGSWLEQAIMRRTSRRGASAAATKPLPGASAAPVETKPQSAAVPSNTPPLSAAPIPAPVSDAAPVAPAPTSTAPVVTNATRTAPVADAATHAAPHADNATSSAPAAVDGGATLALDAATNTTPVVDAADEESLDAVLGIGAPADSPIGVSRREVLQPRPEGRSIRLSPLPVLAIGGVVAALGIGAYLLLWRGADDSDKAPPSVAATPSPAPPATAPASAVPPTAPPQPPATPGPAQAAAPTPPASPSPPTAPATPSPSPAASTTPRSLPPGIPAPQPGVQPSFLTPVPGIAGATPPADDPAPVGPMATDVPSRVGPLVAEKDSIPNLVARANVGDVDAQIELGKRYTQGIGTPQNPAAALHWLEKAAEAGSSQAQFNVGVMYERGLGTPPNVAKAVEWYRKAAAQPIPVPMALHNLALLYISGGGIPSDPAQARALMTRAAEMDVPESQYTLALMDFHGVGGKPDKAMALSWLRLAVRKTSKPEWIEALQQLVSVMTPAEQEQAHELSNQHVKRINDTLAALRAKATGAGEDTPLDRNGLIELQKLLARLQFYTGPTDGAMGPKTEQAIRDYQGIAGLPVDGRPTAELLAGLRDVAGAVK